MLLYYMYTVKVKKKNPLLEDLDTLKLEFFEYTQSN